MGLIFGEVISETRKTYRNNTPKTFDFYFEFPTGVAINYFLDVSAYSNELAFCNHSCNANCSYYSMVFKNELVLAVYANRAIKSSEYLHLDYFRDGNDGDEFSDGCKCGARNCRFKKNLKKKL